MTLEEIARLRELRFKVAGVLREVDSFLRENDLACDPTPTLANIKSVVASYFRISINDLNSPRKVATLVYARQVAMYLCRQLTPHSLPAIGNVFGGRDHTTVLHGVRAIERLMQQDDDVAHDVAALLVQFAKVQS